MTDRLVLDYVASRDGVPAFPSGMGRTVQGESARPFPPLGQMLWRAGGTTAGTLPHLAPDKNCPEPRAVGLGFTQDLFLNRDASEHPAIKPHLKTVANGYDKRERALVQRAFPMSEALWRALGAPEDRGWIGAAIHTMPHGLPALGGRVEVVAKLSGQPGAFSHLWLFTWGAKARPGSNGGNVWENDFNETPGHEPDRIYLTQHGIPGVNKRGGSVKLGFSMADGYHAYGSEWGRDWIKWTVDGKEVRRDAKPDHLTDDSRLYLMCGLGVGAQREWAKPPNPSSKAPFRQYIRSIRAWEA